MRAVIEKDIALIMHETSLFAKQRMPKQAKSSTAKVRQTCQEYPDEFSATPAGDLRCNLCDVLVKCDKVFYGKPTKK